MTSSHMSLVVLVTTNSSEHTMSSMIPLFNEQTKRFSIGCGATSQQSVNQRRRRHEAPCASPTSGGGVLTKERGQMGNGLQERLGVHGQVGGQRWELVVQQ